jgi:hypothetical protein
VMVTLTGSAAALRVICGKKMSLIYLSTVTSLTAAGSSR